MTAMPFPPSKRVAEAVISGLVGRSGRGRPACMVFAALAGFGLLAMAPSIGRAQDPAIEIAKGQVLFKGDLNVSGNLALPERSELIGPGAVPRGTVAFWSGSEKPPPGWVPCDGRTLSDGSRVPDLRGLFMKGMLTDDKGNMAAGEVPWDQNPDKAVDKLGYEHLPSHTHVIENGSLPAFTNNTDAFYSKNLQNAFSRTENKNMEIRNEGSNSAIDLRPPYTVLVYMIYVGPELGG